MASTTKMKLKYYLYLLLTIFSVNCANQLPPGGGEVDLIPPEIIETFPVNGTTNYDKNYIEITFSEYVEKRSVREAIFISPNIEGEIIFNWSGTSCRIIFPEKFKEDITYVITFGTDIVDYNNRNKMAEAVSIYFSTGDKIDEGFIQGKIYSENPEGVMIFAYRVDEKDVNPSEDKPDYVSQSGNEGNFILSGLANGTYRVFAVKDEFRDFLFQAEQDLIGIPNSDIVLNDIDTAYVGLNYFMSKIDTIPPVISSVTMTDKHHLLIGLSEEYDVSSLNINNYSIIDSTENIIINPVYIYIRESSGNNEFVIVINNEFKKDNDVFFVAKNIKDKSGNINNFDFTKITISDRPDTIKPSLIKSNPFSGSDKVDYLKPVFNFVFDDAIDVELLSETIKVIDTLKNEYKYDFEKIDDASFNIKIDADLPRNNFYSIIMDLNNAVDIAGNKYDSIYVHKFKTITGLEFTGLSGKVENVILEDNPILILKRIDEPKEENYYPLNGFNKFNYERITAGKFTLMTFYDTDNNGKYTFGYPYPFQPSEKFVYYHEEIQLRARWSLTDLLFNMKR